MIYLDNAATTRPDKDCLSKAEIFNNECFFNPSALYRGGLNCAKAIKEAKDAILRFLGVSSSDYEVIFTSCGTESDNSAIFCSVKRGCFVTDKGEHSAVYNCFAELKNKGNTVQFIDLNKDGSVNVEALYDFVKANKTDFVSIVHVNNETGAINDVNLISRKLKEINPDLIFHTDGVQSFGKIPFRLSESVDMFSLSAHKINGLKGVGALVKKRRIPFSPLILGGGQESNMRSGTENVFGIKVLVFAAEKKYANIEDNYKKAKELNLYVRNNINTEIIKVVSSESGSPYILSLSAVGLKGEVIMHALEEYGIIIGNGSACSSRNKYSRIMQAWGYDKPVLEGALRVSFSSENTMEEIKAFTKTLNITVNKFKGIMR